MKYRRGFKTEAERIALDVRAELGLSATDALDVFAVAERWGIPVIPMSALTDGRGAHGFLRVFRAREQDSFSAVTIFNGTARSIVHNDSHHPCRQSSNIAHELSHCILEHQPTHLRDGESGCRVWNATYEAEADWLGGALLIPREGGLYYVKSGWGIGQVAEHFRVSEPLARWRIYQTGIMQHADRFARRWA
jgi:Zn-dependent peptidase ImmA (M78 family)